MVIRLPYILGELDILLFVFALGQPLTLKWHATPDAFITYALLKKYEDDSPPHLTLIHKAMIIDIVSRTLPL